MTWKKILQQLDTLTDEELEAFANQNLWNPESCSDSQSRQLDKLLAELMSKIGNNTDLLLRVLDMLLPAFNPLKVAEENFDTLKNILIEPTYKTLSSIQCATRICIAALNSHHLESLASFQERLKTCAKRLLDCFISETQHRWSTFGSIDMGKEQFTQKMALDPSRIPRLEYVVFSFGMAKPLLFYDLLNDMAMDINTRLQAFMLLKSFLILEDAPTYYLIDSELYKTVIISALMDTDVSLFLTAITILTILLPIVATKSLPHLNQLLSILLKAIDWEISYPYILTQLSPNSNSKSTSNTPNIDDILATHSVSSVQRCVNQYFTVLYGMFPANTMSYLGQFLKAKESAIIAQSGFTKATDAFEDLRKSVMTSIELIPARTKKVEAILASHKCHLNTILLDPKQERDNPWFMNKESSEIMIACFNLESQEFQNTSSPLSSDAATSLDDIASHILQINRFLYGPNFVKHLPQLVDPKAGVVRDHQTPQDRVILLKIFYIILTNEGFFKECMRQYHIFHIRQLRKSQIRSQISQTQTQSTALQIEALQTDLKASMQLNSTLQSEIKKLESRLKILDLSHIQRFNSTTNQLREKTKALLQTQAEVKDHKDEIKGLEEKMEVYKSRIVDFETRMGFFDAEIARNEILVSENTDLKAKLAAKSTPEPSSNATVPVDTHSNDVGALQVVNDSLTLQLQKAKETIKALESQISKQSTVSLLQSKLDAKTKAFGDLMFLLATQKEKGEERDQRSKSRIIALEKELLGFKASLEG